MKRHLRFFTTVFLALLFTFIAHVNWRLYYSPEVRVVEGDTINYDALCQLRYLRDAMENNAANEMQHLYPEGYVFFNALYGLSWCDLAETLDKKAILFEEAHVEIQRAFNNVNSKQGRIIFDDALPLPYGSFYNGWLTYLLGKKLNLELPGKRDSAEVQFFKTQCKKIALAIEKQTYPETYYTQSWPADVVLCVAALAQHDKLYTGTYQRSIKSWWKRVSKNLDPSGLIPHSAHPVTGKPLQHARGSSQSLMQCFLPEIIGGTHNVDSYNKMFAGTRFGLPGIQEYPKGTDGSADIDSGPVVLGMGGAATIVGMRAMKVNGFHNESTALRNTIEAFAFPLKMNGRKKYLLGKLPIADVFITWAQGPYYKRDLKENAGDGWRREFQMWSVGIGVLILVGLVWMWKYKKP
jgi:hypothetical protein